MGLLPTSKKSVVSGYPNVIEWLGTDFLDNENNISIIIIAIKVTYISDNDLASLLTCFLFRKGHVFDSPKRYKVFDVLLRICKTN